MADNTWQMRTMLSQFGMLDTHYMHDPNTFVAVALLLYYTEGEPVDVVAPDIFVSRGVPKGHREWYKVWVEGKVPDFALEVSSEESAEDNLGRNMETYARIGIPEYCVYDPMGGLHSPRLQLFRLSGGVPGAYKRVEWSGDTEGSLAVPSESLGLELRFEDDRLRLWDPAAREYLLEYSEERDRRIRERDRWLTERDRRIRERDRWLTERDGHMVERAKRVAAEQRAAELEREVEALKARRRGRA